MTLTALPKIIENLSFADIFNEKLKRFTAAYKKVVPEFQEPTPADPLYFIIAELTFSELVGRERINQAAYSQLLKFSNEIAFLFAGQLRDGESYEAYRERMRNTLNLASPAGSIAMYKALTFLYGEASLTKDQKVLTGAVTDAFVDSVNGELFIYVLMNTEDSDLKTSILSRLTATFQKETVAPALDRVAFLEAKSTPFAIAATILLRPGYDITYREAILKNIQSKFLSEKRLGWGPSTSWIVKELHQEGVRSVILTSPGTDISVIPSKYAAISSIDLKMEAAK